MQLESITSHTHKLQLSVASERPQIVSSSHQTRPFIFAVEYV